VQVVVNSVLNGAGIFCMNEFGEWLRQARDRKDWSGERLGEEIGVNQSNISMYERGERKPRRARLLKIAAALGVSAVEALDVWSKSGLDPEVLDPEQEESQVIQRGDKVLLKTGDVVTFLGPNGEEGEVELTPELFDVLNNYAIGRKTRSQQNQNS
jgi:transcriptional regulator with XRE-family HTH domain